MAYTTIDNPELYFQTKLYTGNGTDDTAITLDGSENMAPNFVWIKKRNATEDHVLFDTIRGATKYIKSNSDAAEATDTGSLKSFDSDGFTLGTAGRSNNNTNLFVAWCWKGGSAVSGDTQGSGTLKTYVGTVSTLAGISITKYTGNGTSGHRVPHNLGAVPKIVIVKKYDASAGWVVYSSVLTSSAYYLSLETTAAQDNGEGTVFLNDPTSTYFGMGAAGTVNTNDNTFISYSFAPIQGFSKFGTYKGNASLDGPFVYLGFRPAFVMVKSYDYGTYNWHTLDNKRSSSGGKNVVGYNLMANSSAVEGTSDNYMIDILSNGFKLRDNNEGDNSASANFIYMAFAEAPFVNSNGVPCNAR